MNKKFLTILLFCSMFFAFVSCKNSSDSSSIPYYGLTTNSDWLFLFYLDGDDTTLNDSFYKCLKEMEYALTKMRNEDGSQKTGFPSVNFVVLWDGISEELKGSSIYLHPNGALYELGPDYNLNYIPYQNHAYRYGDVYVPGTESQNYTLGNSFSLSSNTKDLTATAASWLPQEPNMSDPSTLTYFLIWAKARYAAQNVVLVLDDHGAGTYKETYTNSTALVNASLCTDATNGNGRLLTCKNVTDALKTAGYTGNNKIKILWNDVCLQATAEIINNYSGCAEYFWASPNTSFNFNLYELFTRLKSGMTAKEFGKVMVSSYYERFYNNCSTLPTNLQNARNSRSSGYSMITASFFSLDSQKIQAMKTAVDNFATALLSIKTSNNTLFTSIYNNCIKQNIDSLSDCKGLAYSGTYAWLNDLGYLAKEVLANDNLTAAHASAQVLVDLLTHGDDKLIIYAWGGKRAYSDISGSSYAWGNATSNSYYLTDSKNLASNETITVENPNAPYGMTIVGSYWSNDANVVDNYSDWTGFSAAWGQVISAWKNGN